MLETIALPGSDRVTTRLGFGGSGLMGGISERESLRLLETAFDAGIRHHRVDARALRRLGPPDLIREDTGARLSFLEEVTPGSRSSRGARR